MKMNIDIEDKLILAAMKISGVKTKKRSSRGRIEIDHSVESTKRNS